MSNALQGDKPTKVSFYIFRTDGSRNPDIKFCFLTIRSIDIYDAAAGFIIWQEDNTKWNLVLEKEVSSKLAQEKEVKCMISMQARQQGNYAVCRLYDEARDRKARVK